MDSYFDSAIIDDALRVGRDFVTVNGPESLGEVGPVLAVGGSGGNGAVFEVVNQFEESRFFLRRQGGDLPDEFSGAHAVIVVQLAAGCQAAKDCALF